MNVQLMTNPTGTFRGELMQTKNYNPSGKQMTELED